VTRFVPRAFLPVQTAESISALADPLWRQDKIPRKRLWIGDQELLERTDFRLGCAIEEEAEEDDAETSSPVSPDESRILLIWHQRAGVGQDSLHVLDRQFRIVEEELVQIRVSGQLGQNQLHRHPGAFDDRLADHHGWVDGYTVRDFFRYRDIHHLSVGNRIASYPDDGCCRVAAARVS